LRSRSRAPAKQMPTQTATQTSAACQNMHGTCTQQSSCSGTVQRGLCPGPANIICCVKSSPTTTSSACSQQNGECGQQSGCSGKIVRGLCPGPSNIICCVKGGGGGGDNGGASPPNNGGGDNGGASPPASGQSGSGCINARGVNLIKGFEGFDANFYRDSVGVLTIGYGHACQPDSACNNIHAPLSEPQAARMLASELTTNYGPCMRSRVTRPLNNNQYSALTSFVYNLGCGILKGGLLSSINAGNWNAVASSMQNYNHAGGRVLLGLTRRRQAEAALLLSPVSGNDGTCFS